MYHIKQDKRSLLSAKMIENGLRDCLHDKDFPSIGVSELCEKAEVSRSTFYRLFDTPVDVLQYLVDSLVQEASEKVAAEGIRGGGEYIQFYLEFVEKNIPLLETIIVSGRMDILSRALTDHSTTLVPAELLEQFSENELDYLRAVLSASAVALYRVSLEHGGTESPKEMREIFAKLLKLLYENLM